jgi:hypothetical protein
MLFSIQEKIKETKRENKRRRLAQNLIYIAKYFLMNCQKKIWTEKRLLTKVTFGDSLKCSWEVWE